jgi:Flp pilus assembly protein TadG
MRFRTKGRPGTTVVECAVVYPVVFMLLLALVIGSMGMFRYQEIASLAREGARYASVHGTQYAKEANVTPPTPADIFNQAIVSRAAALDLSQLSYAITYNTSNQPYHTTIDANHNIVPIQNTVQVTLTYQWVPEAWWGGGAFTSTSVMPMSY